MSELIFNVYSIIFIFSLLVTATLIFFGGEKFGDNVWDWFWYSALWPLHLLKSLVKSLIKIIIE